MSTYFGNPISEHGVFPLDDSTMIRWRLRNPPRLTQCSPVMIMIRSISPAADGSCIRCWKQLVVKKTQSKTRVWEGLQFAIPSMLRKIRPLCIQMWKQMPTTVVPAQVARLDRWWYVEKAAADWIEELYEEYSICISLNSHRPYYWDPLPGMVQSLASDRRCFHAPPASYTPIWLGCRQECQVEVRKGGDTDGPASFKSAFLTPC